MDATGIDGEVDFDEMERYVLAGVVFSKYPVLMDMHREMFRQQIRRTIFSDD